MARDLISQKYFNQRGITLDVGQSVDEDDFDLFNNVELLARLTGAPDGSRIFVSRGEAMLDTFNLRVTNPLFKYPSEYLIINLDGKLRFQLEVDSIYIREDFQDKGIGVRSVMLSILEAKSLGFGSVTLFAAGSAEKRDMFFGYHVWPSMGFDAPIPGIRIEKLTPDLQGCRLLSDLMSADAGEKWWYDWGVELQVTFELSNDSVSWKLLDEYAKAKEISL